MTAVQGNQSDEGEGKDGNEAGGAKRTKGRSWSEVRIRDLMVKLQKRTLVS